ncbi:MAG: hypothetical protein KAX49_07690 [Halanaerobiales bacterium]|nr:hypothetical protein [Halanaerobiales bacterium]
MLSNLDSSETNDWNEREVDELIDICAFYDVGKRYTHYYMVQDGERSDQKMRQKLEPSFFVKENINKNIIIQY